MAIEILTQQEIEARVAAVNAAGDDEEKLVEVFIGWIGGAIERRLSAAMNADEIRENMWDYLADRCCDADLQCHLMGIPDAPEAARGFA